MLYSLPVKLLTSTVNVVDHTILFSTLMQCGLIHRNLTFFEEPTEIPQTALGHWLPGQAQWQK